MTDKLLFTGVLLSMIVLAVDGHPLQIDHGEYQVVVAIDPAMAYDETMVERVETMMRDASKYLWNSLEEQALFGMVVILIPDRWPDHPFQRASAGETVAGADIFIGKGIGCGACSSPGRIQMDDGFMDGPTVVHEWGHYRFGLGDEYCDYQFMGGEWFQVYRTSAGWNRCTALQEIERDCEWRAMIDPICNIIGESANGAGASIMHRQWNPGIHAWCDDGPDEKFRHNAVVNTHHNRINDRKSCWAVIESHPDGFKRRGGPRIAYRDPVFEIKKPTTPDIVLVVDVSTSMEDERIRHTVRAARNFVERSEIGTAIGVVSFSSYALALLPLTPIRKDDPSTPEDEEAASRREIRDAIPMETTGATSIGSGLRKALEIFAQGERGAPKVMVLLSDGEENTPPLVADILPDVTARKIEVHTIGLGADSDRRLQPIASDTGGRYYFAEDGDVQALNGAFTTIANAAAGHQGAILLSQGWTVGPGKSRRVEVLVDGATGSNTVFSFSIDGVSVADIDILLTGPDMEIIDASYAGYTVDEELNNILVRLHDIETSGIWEIGMANAHASDEAEIVLEATSRARTDESPLILTGTLDRNRTDAVAPVGVSASLFSGEAVVNASVRAEVTAPGGEVTNIPLRDNGQGADRFVGDGYYAGYISGFSADGRYTVRVHADDGQGRASIGAIFRDGPAVRNDLPLASAGGDDGGPVKVPTGVRFKRTVFAGAFEVDGTTGAGDAVPPSPITTLTVSAIGESEVTLSWIATGDDADQGIAARYDLRYSTTPIGDESAFLAAARVDGPETPAGSGSEETHVVTGLSPDTRYYFAVKAVDEAGNASALSNVYFADTTPEPTQPDEPDGGGGGDGCFIGTASGPPSTGPAFPWIPVDPGRVEGRSESAILSTDVP